MQAPSVWLAIYHAHCEASSLQGKPAKYHLIRMLKTVERAASPEAKMSLAAFYGWHTQLARLLAAHRDVDLSLAHMRDTRDPPTPPLHQACIRGHERCAAILLAYRADPSSIYRGRTALQHAAEHGNMAIIERLLLEGATSADVNYTQLLHSAVSSGRASLVPLLVRLQADVNGSLGHPIIHAAVISQSRPCFDRLLELRADPLVPDSHQRSAISRAVAQQSFEFVQLLLELGASVPPESIPRACKDGNLAIVELLLQHITAPLDYSNSALRRYLCSLPCLRLLLSSGRFDPNHPQCAPILFLAFESNMDAVPLLLEFGADPYAIDPTTGGNLLQHCHALCDVDRALPYLEQFLPNLQVNLLMNGSSIAAYVCLADIRIIRLLKRYGARIIEGPDIFHPVAVMLLCNYCSLTDEWIERATWAIESGANLTYDITIQYLVPELCDWWQANAQRIRDRANQQQVPPDAQATEPM